MKSLSWICEAFVNAGTLLNFQLVYLGQYDMKEYLKPCLDLTKISAFSPNAPAHRVLDGATAYANVWFPQMPDHWKIEHLSLT